MVIFLWATMSVRLVPTYGEEKNTIHRDQRKRCAVVNFWVAGPTRKVVPWDSRPTSTIEMGSEIDNGMNFLEWERKMPIGRRASGSPHSEVQWQEFLCRRQYPTH